MNVATSTVEPMNAAATSGSHETSLGPPFFSPPSGELTTSSSAVRGWEVLAPVPAPRGFFASAKVDSYNGTYWAELGAAPHPPNAPLTIGWYWWGWRRRQVFVRYPGYFTVKVQPGRILVNHNGGNWVPKCHISLHKGRTLIADSIENMYSGLTCKATVQAPPGWFDLSLGGSIRAVYSGAASPYGTVDAEVSSVTFSYYPGALMAQSDAEVAQEREVDVTPLLAEDNEPSTEELHEQLTRFHEETEGRALGSVEEVREAGLVSF